MSSKTRYSGRIRQLSIFFVKLLRTFIYQRDWKSLPMAAVIAALVVFVIGKSLFLTQEGTLMGCFALICVCIWNGFFNSIQVVCRERPIIKREHRAGMHISSYVVSHMAYQFLLCLMQTLITVGVCLAARVKFPEKALVTGWFLLDFGITMLLTTYAADMIALTVSCLVRDTTVAMTVVPFLLIFQLVFSGFYFSLTGFATKLTKFTVSKWGLKGLATLGDFNSLPMTTLWTTLLKFREVEVMPGLKISDILSKMDEAELAKYIQQQSGLVNQNAEFVFEKANLMHSWGVLALMALIFAVIAIVLLEFVDRDKR